MPVELSLLNLPTVRLSQQKAEANQAKLQPQSTISPGEQPPGRTAALTYTVEEPVMPQDATLFPTTLPFGSEAANLEYSILSAILGNPSPPEQDMTPSPAVAPEQSFTSTSWPGTDTLSFLQPSFPPPLTDPSLSLSSTDTSNIKSPNASTLMGFASASNGSMELPNTQYAPSFTVPTTQIPIQQRWPLDDTTASSPPSTFVPTAQVPPGRGFFEQGPKLQGINDRIIKAYDYTEGYHFLMKHLPSRYSYQSCTLHHGAHTCVCPGSRRMTSSA